MPFSSPPAVTSPTLPVASPPLAAGARHRFVVRRRNRYGLTSLNSAEWSVVTDADGVRLGGVPPRPAASRLLASPGGAVRVVSRVVPSLSPPANRPTHWAVWVGVGGATPDVTADAPTAILPLTAPDGVARLDWVADAARPAGQTVPVAVATRIVRDGGAAVDGEPDRMVATVPAAPDAPDASLHPSPAD